VSSPTGRITQQKPALQSPPVRTEIGRKIQEAFTREAVLRQAPPTVNVDYEALELRILASMVTK
jgi:DNA polymerase I-like protein with 3'-5' exonuclease and polymerase domains